MRFWVELKDHVPNGQIGRHYCGLTRLTRNKLMANQCPVAKASQPLQKIIEQIGIFVLN